MDDNFKSARSHLTADLIILLICTFGVINFWHKADLPFSILHSQNQLLIRSDDISKTAQNENTILISLDGIKFNSREEIEVYLDSKSIGDNIIVESSFNQKQTIRNFKLISFYSPLYYFVALLVGLIFFATGILVLLKGRDKRVGIIFHWCMISTSMIILMTWGNFTKLGLFTGILTRTGFHLGYAFIPSLFLHFSLLFPFESKHFYKNFLKVAYSFSVLFALTLSIIFIIYAYNISHFWIDLYLNFYDACSIFVIIFILFAIYIQYKNYNSTKLLSDRKKLRWILLGYFIGPITYLFLWVIPQRLTSEGLIPEEFVLLLISAVPITFAIAILKYHIMDTEIIVRRTIVYPFAILILVVVYFSIFNALLSLFNFHKNNFTSITSAIIIALLFHPLKEMLKHFVNKRIFKVEYDYRTALNNFLYEMKETANVNELTQKIIDLLNKLMPITKAGYFTYSKSEDNFKLLTNSNMEEFKDKDISIDLKTSLKKDSLIFALKNYVEPETQVDFSMLPIFNFLKIKLLCLVKSETGRTLGILVLGEKKSNARFTVEDIDLLNIILSKLGETIDRLILQEELFMEKIEIERLEKLNELKSFFVSSVSHDLKTPLTSIKMFAEILKNSKNISEEKKGQYLDIIEGESNRLSRLIENVLNYTKIEKGIKEYNFEKIEINKVTKEVMNSMEYLLMMQKFTCKLNLYKEDLFILADKDSVKEMIINLISNSMKFSLDKKIITVSTKRENDSVIISVQDEGIGISENDKKNIFSAFFQSNELSATQSSGAGLGLTIVKNIIDAHKGKIEFESTLGKGSKFNLVFPKVEETYEQNINY